MIAYLGIENFKNYTLSRGRYLQSPCMEATLPQALATSKHHMTA